MIYLNIEDESVYKKIVELLSEYFPNKAFLRVKDKGKAPYYEIRLSDKGDLIMVFYDKELDLDKKLSYSKGQWQKEEVKHLFYQVLKKHLYPLPWGTLVAVRPTSPLKKLSEVSKEAQVAYLKSHFEVSRFRASLATEVFEIEKRVRDEAKDSFGLYINIPFCPSRCLYCSFPSIVKKQSSAFYEAYLKTLIEELRLCQDFYKNKGLKTVYIGGGTPAMLEGEAFEKIFEALERYYALSKASEVTVELGRPELIKKSQLDVLAHYNTSQISINAQTLNDNLLASINRGHTKADFLRAYHLVKESYSIFVNVDLILGLPNDTVKDYKGSLKDVLKLKPEFLTLHTLCEKRGAKLDLKTSRKNYEAVSAMWAYSHKTLFESAYKPYYLYRQKRMVAPFENLGFSRLGLINQYNLLMLSSDYPILGFGMGATTKLVSKGKTKTVINYRNMKSYLEGYQLTIEKKRSFLKGEDNVKSNTGH